ncbi:hypothetical protein [Hymenobacter terrenus]|uniref:hypothetical protein n=1 Tax=Hymenobacter terrenus TaxID=1629124 RepID=UPI00061904DC|nr:hypothetical protein [Hymenobacter terrenus]
MQNHRPLQFSVFLRPSQASAPRKTKRAVLPVLSFSLAAVLLGAPAWAQDGPQNKGQFILLSGITQPLLLKGSNIAFNYGLSDRIILEGSFGFGLSYKNLLSDEDEKLFNDVRTPLTGGFGIGYVPIKNLVVMFEPKFTNYKVEPKADKSFQYTTFTAGLGAYYNIYLFKGLLLQPAVKYWPKVGSTLNGDETTFRDAEGALRVDEARTPGNDGFIYNISLGWNFNRK